MKKSVRLEISPERRERSQQACCSVDALCARCSMIRVTSHRFGIFFEKFGRLPEVNDELFFDETSTSPVRASQGAIRNQILAAAQAHGLNYFLLLSYLGLGSVAVGEENSL
ncbi:MAG TPA: hypothetical protein VNE63_01915 [Candidatus Acidoferrales bacterium]|nr:hypothetical protein [Candidatus Acidoferrales bacterium]